MKDDPDRLAEKDLRGLILTVLARQEVLNDKVEYVRMLAERTYRHVQLAHPLPVVTVYKPNGDISMSGSQPQTLTPVTIALASQGSGKPNGWVAVNPIDIANSDGTAPTVQISAPGTITDGGVQGPDAAGNYGWSAVAAGAGQVTVSFLADGVVNYTLSVTVNPPTDETLNIPATAVTTGAPGTTPPAFT